MTKSYKLAGALSGALFSLALTASPASYAATHPEAKVMILATGGTIAGEAEPEQHRSAIGYQPGALSVQQIIKSVPGIEKLADIKGEQISNISSQDMTYSLWHKLASRIESACNNHEADSFVITHGTDTLEETAFFLDNVVSDRCPVVLTGSMRPSTALSADGPSNLYQAVKVAADPKTKHRGVQIVLNDEIQSARWATKTNTTDVQTFMSRNQGVTGYVDAAQVRYVVPAEQASRPFYKLPATLPKVEIIYAHTDMMDGGKQVDDLVKGGSKGIICAGSGDGNCSTDVINALERAHKQGVTVVRSNRLGTGFVNRNIELDDDKLGFLVAEDLNPHKARILTQLIIATGHANDPLMSVQDRFKYKG